MYWQNPIKEIIGSSASTVYHRSNNQKKQIYYLVSALLCPYCHTHFNWKYKHQLCFLREEHKMLHVQEKPLDLLNCKQQYEIFHTNP